MCVQLFRAVLGNHVWAIIFELGLKVSYIVTTETCGEVSVVTSCFFFSVIKKKGFFCVQTV